MSKVEVDQVTQQSGTTLTVGGGACKTAVVDATTVTLGRCGGTVSLASGATQSGFGRTGTVDWETTPKTGDFTGANGQGYFINTTSGNITMTLPSASAGDIISIQDYNNTFDTYSFTIQAPGGVSINGGTTGGKLILNTEGQGLTLIYVDVTVGWRSIESTTFSSTSTIPTYITASVSGACNTLATTGDYKVATFLNPGTFTVCSVGNPGGSDTIDYLVVAGGGAGGNGSSAGGYGAGGAGAGGYRESSGTASGGYTISPLGACVAALPVTATGYPVTVGAGGAIDTRDNYHGNNGADSVFTGSTTITSAGGGAGGGTYTGPQKFGNSGGSGGVGGSCAGKPPSTPSCGGSGNTPPVPPPQGEPGGNGNPPSGLPGGAGGGALGAGDNGPAVGPPSVSDADGGPGGTSSINGTPTARAGGGGSGGLGTSGGDGGAGGGGPGGQPDSTNGVAGTANTGGGGGGGSGGTGIRGGAGGSGIVIIRYKFQN